MNKIKEIITKESIEIPSNTKSISITLYVDSAAAGQTTAVWVKNVESCLTFANNQIQGCAYMQGDTIIIENVIAYIVFFN